MARSKQLLSVIVGAIVFSAGTGPGWAAPEVVAGRLDPTFSAPTLPVGTSVRNLWVQNDNKILMMVSVGQPLKPLRRLHPDGTADSSFTSPEFSPTPELAVAFQGERILVGGSFTNVNGIRANGIVRLNADGTLDPSFNTSTRFGVRLGDQFVEGRIHGLATLPGGKIMVGGTFRVVNETDTLLARLHPDGTHDPAFSVPFSPFGAAMVREILADQDTFVVAGLFGFTGPLAGRRGSIARFHMDGSLDPSFESSVRETSFNINIELDNGRVLLMYPRAREVKPVTRLLPNGQVDPAFTANFDREDFLVDLKVQPDSKVLVAQDLPFGPQSGKYLVRLNTDGSLDEGFVPPALDARISCLALQPPGRVLIGGFFRGGGVQLPSVLRLIGDESAAVRPQITESPRSGSISTGDNARFSVQAVGQPRFYYWQRNGEIIPGATNAVFVIWNSQPADAGQYRVVVSNVLGQVSSASATLEVLAPEPATNLVLNASFEEISANVSSGAPFLIGVTNWTGFFRLDLFHFPVSVPFNYRGEQMVLNGTNYLGFVGSLAGSPLNSPTCCGVVTGRLAQPTVPGGRYVVEASFSRAELSAAAEMNVELLLADAQGASVSLGEETITNTVDWQRYHRSVIVSRAYDQIIIRPGRAPRLGEGYLYADKVFLGAVSHIRPVFAAGPEVSFAIAPLTVFSFTNTVIGNVTDGALSFRLDSSAPSGFSIDPRTGVLRGITDLTDAGKTNRIAVIAAYNDSELLSSTSVVNLVVMDAWRLGIGHAQVRAGESASVPIVMQLYGDPETQLTNISFELQFPPGRVTDIQFTNLHPALGEGTVTPTGASSVLINYGVREALVGPQALGELRLGTVSTQVSGFFPVIARNAIGTKNNGDPLSPAYIEVGRIGVIGREALWDTAVVSGTRTVRLYGLPGKRYGLETTARISSPIAWVFVRELVLTNAFVELFEPETNVAARFFRVRELP